MRRRTFLQLGSLASVALLARRAFADTALPATAPPETVDVDAALARAGRRGVPLFAIVVPDDDAKKWNIGGAWGQLLQRGKDEAAPLADAEVICVTMRRLRRSVPSVPQKAEPLAVTIDPATGAARLHTTELPAWPERFRVHVKGEKQPPSDDEIAAQRLSAMGQLVANALPGTKRDTVGAMAKVKAALLDRPPPGSHWASASGCGPAKVKATPEEIEARRRADEEARKKGIIRMRGVVGYGCGMGHVPEAAREFLWFYARNEDQD
jgi:hypothetical protein